MPDSTSSSGSSPDIFTNPSSDYWVDYPVRQTAPSEPDFKLPEKNIGYFSSSVPSTVPGWRIYKPYQGTSTTIPSGYDPVGWVCSNCYFKLSKGGKNLCTKYRFEIPLGSWRCNSYVTKNAKFTPFVSEQTPLANEDVLQLVDQQGRYLVDIYRFINIDPSGSYIFITNYHAHTSTTNYPYVPVFIIGPMRYNPFGTMYDVIPAVRGDWLPFAKYGTTYFGACIPMSLTEKPGYVQYDIEPVSNNFTNLRFLPKTNQSLEFIGVGAPEGFVVMMQKSIVDNFMTSGVLPSSYGWFYNYDYWYSLYRTTGPKIIFSSGDDLVSSKPVLDAYGDKSVPVSVNPDMFSADGVKPVPVKRDNLAVTEVSTGLLGIPREEKSLNLFEDINRYGLDTTRWVAKTSYQYQSVEPVGWFNSYGVRNNPDEQVPAGALPYETALRVESDIQNSGINLLCRVPPSSFPYHRFSGYGQSAYDDAKGKWDSKDISFPYYGSPRVSGVTSSVELTSRQYFAYQPGRITGFTFGVRACPPEFVGSASEVTWGIENDENAMFFKLSGGVWSLVRSRFNTFNKFTQKWLSYRTETIAQGSFNGDNLNGFGSSGYVMQWDKVTMFKIEYGWYGGVGARLYIYVPVGNKAAKWVRIHDFGPPQSDSEPDTPSDLKNKRYPTLSTPWFRVFYRITSANGLVNDQGLLSLSKYGVSVYIDGGNPNSPQITNVPGGIRKIPAYNAVEVLNGENISSGDAFPIIGVRYKQTMKKRLTADSIAGAKTETTNYKVIVPKRLSVTAVSSNTQKDLPIRLDMWTASGVTDPQATTGKTFYYPDGYNYTLSGLLQDSENSKNYYFKKGTGPWWSLVPPAYLAPDWSRAEVSGDLPQETGNSPSRPNAVDATRRRYQLATYNYGGAYLRGGQAFGVPLDKDPYFYALRIVEVGSTWPDPFSQFRDPYFYSFNYAPDAAEISKVGSIAFKHPDMCLVSDPIFDSYFTWSVEATGNVYVGLYYHKPSVSSSSQTANVISGQSGWQTMLENEITNGMWPLHFTPYSLHSAYGLFSEGSDGRAYLDTDSVLRTKYTLDNIASSVKYNTASTRIIGGVARGGEFQDWIGNPEGYGVHFVVLMSPGSSIKNLNVTVNPNSNDAEQRAIRFLGQSDSKYAGSWANTFLSKFYGKSVIGTGVEFPSTVGYLNDPYGWVKNLKNIYTSSSFKWGRPNVSVVVGGSSERTPVSFKDYDENSGIKIDTEASQKLTASKYQLLGSFFINAPKVGNSAKNFMFDLSNFFSYNGTAIRGPGDYTFFVTAKNLTSVEDGGTTVVVSAAMQCEEG